MHSANDGVCSVIVVAASYMNRGSRCVRRGAGRAGCRHAPPAGCARHPARGRARASAQAWCDRSRGPHTREPTDGLNIGGVLRPWFRQPTARQLPSLSSNLQLAIQYVVGASRVGQLFEEHVDAGVDGEQDGFHACMACTSTVRQCADGSPSQVIQCQVISRYLLGSTHLALPRGSLCSNFCALLLLAGKHCGGDLRVRVAQVLGGGVILRFFTPRRAAAATRYSAWG